jgi:hypothetical protein
MFKSIKANPANAQKIFFLFVSKGLLSKHVPVTAIDSMQFFKGSAYYCTELLHRTKWNGEEKA